MINFKNSYRKYVFGLEQINLAAKTNPQEFIDSLEESFQSELHDAANFILKSTCCKIVMISGPSSSGKTTSAYMLKEMLTKAGKDSQIVSLDDFFLGKNKVPIDETGKRNYDSIDAIDVQKVKDCIKELIEIGESTLPVYNFVQMRPDDKTQNLKISKDSIVIIEGIHALNPVLLPDVNPECIVKIYVNVKQGINDCYSQILSPTDIRFIRRLVRDFKYRATPVEHTLEMWDSVCRNANIYISPFKRSSDLTINSIHMYEPCILSKASIPLLRSVRTSNKYYEYVNDLSYVLERFIPIDDKLVPQDSLMREFL